MGSQTKLTTKLRKLSKDVRTKTKSKSDLRSEVLNVHNVVALIRGEGKPKEDAFVVDSTEHETGMSIEIEATSFYRNDFSIFDYGVKMTLAEGLVESLGLQAGDKVTPASGECEGMTLTIESVNSEDDELRFEDDKNKSLETSILCTVTISSDK